MKELVYFTPMEFECNGKLCYLDMNEKFLERLDFARGITDVPFRISSSFRTEEHNEKIGGKPDSAHLKGLAVDISCTTSSERFRIVKALLEAGFRRIGISKYFIHVDADDTKPQNVIWEY